MAENRSRLGRRTADDGMTLIEVLFSIVLFAVILLSFAAVVFNAQTTMRTSYARQSVTLTANKTVDQVRALPYATVTSGITRSAAAADPRLVYAGVNRYTLDGYTVLTSDSVPDGTPLNPHIRRADPETNPDLIIKGVGYTVTTYPTLCWQSKTNPNDCAASKSSEYDSSMIRVFVVVSWMDKGVPQSRTTTTIIHSPEACQPNIDRPYSGPCEPFFTGFADATAGTVTVTRGDGAEDGFNFKTAVLTLPATTARLNQEQTITGTAEAAAAATIITTDTEVQATSGGRTVRAVSSTDPGASSVPYDADSLVQENATPLRVAYNMWDETDDEPQGNGSSQYWIAFDPGVDIANAMSTVRANGDITQACPDLSGYFENTQQPCITTGMTGGGGVVYARYGKRIGTADLVRVDPSAMQTRAWTARFTKNGSTKWCLATEGDGCVESALSRSIGAVTIGALPNGVDAPHGWDGYLVRMTPYRDFVSVGRGLDASDARSQVITGSIRYWNGNGYTTIDLRDPATAGTAIPVAPVVATGRGTLYTLTGAFTVGARSVEDTGNTACVTACSSRVTIQSPITGSVTVGTQRNGRSAGTYTATVNLGVAKVQSTYQSTGSGS